MKKLLIAALFLTTTTLSHAWVFPENPDRVPSIGFHATTSHISGQRAEIDSPDGPATREFFSPESRNRNTVGGDLRLPVHQSITLTFSYDSIRVDESFVRQGDVYKQTSLLDGYEAGIGMRMYLSK